MGRYSDQDLKNLAAACKSRHRQFVEGIVIHNKSGTQAAIDAGFTKKSAAAQSTRMLGHPGDYPDLHAYKDALEASMAEKAQATAEDVARELSILAFSNIGDFMEWDNDGIRLKASAEIDQDKLRAIAEIREGPNGRVTIKLVDKGANLERLGKYLGMFVDKVEHSFNVSELLKQRRERARKARQSRDSTPAPKPKATKKTAKRRGKKRAAD